MHEGINPEREDLTQVAAQIIALHQISPSQSRNAYSAMLLIPKFSQLRFVPILLPYKKLWNTSEARFATFWNANDVLKQLLHTPLNSNSVKDVRERLILVWRLFALARSVDLARILRSFTLVRNSPYVLIQRKGWKTCKWEQVITLPETPEISPWHLLTCYAKLTSSHAPEGSLLLRSLKPPYHPLSANCVGLSRNHFLQDLVLTQKFGPLIPHGGRESPYSRVWD